MAMSQQIEDYKIILAENGLEKDHFVAIGFHSSHFNPNVSAHARTLIPPPPPPLKFGLRGERWGYK
jgi:hypothetical protein